MTTTKKNILISAIASIVATLSLSVATYAWFVTSAKINPQDIILRSGVSSVYVKAIGYGVTYGGSASTGETDYTVSDVFVDIGKDGNPVYSPDNSNPSTTGSQDSASLSVTFAPQIDIYDYLDLVQNEVSLSRSYLPRIYLELQYSQDNIGGYVQASFNQGSIEFGESQTSISAYARTITKGQIDSLNPVSDSLMEKLEAGSLSLPLEWNDLPLEWNDLPLEWNDLTPSMPIYSLEGEASQLYVKPYPYYNGDDLHYSCSTLIEITPDPLAFWDYLVEAVNTAGSGSVIFDFTFSIAYSNTAFVDGNNVDLPKLDPTPFTSEEAGI